MKTHTAALRSRHANFISRSEGSRCISPCKTPTPSRPGRVVVSRGPREISSEAQPPRLSLRPARPGASARVIFIHILFAVFDFRGTCRAACGTCRGEKDTTLRPRKWKSRRLYLPSNHILCSRNAHSVTLHGTRHRDICNLGLSQPGAEQEQEKHKARHKQIANTTDRGLCANARVS